MDWIKVGNRYINLQTVTQVEIGEFINWQSTESQLDDDGKWRKLPGIRLYHTFSAGESMDAYTTELFGDDADNLLIEMERRCDNRRIPDTELPFGIREGTAAWERDQRRYKSDSPTPADDAPKTPGVHEA